MKNKNTRGIDDMKIQEKMRKPMLEARYLNVENTDRYRPIIRLFYLKYEKLKYWMYQEDVFEELKEDPYFQEYTMEQCQQDLAALASWGNLLTIQDTRKVTTIEEFKNKRNYTMAKKDNNIEKSYDFGKSEFNRKMKKIYQEREAKGLPNSVDIPNDADADDLARLRAFGEWLSDGQPVD